jgi:hypothetical protein
MSDDPVQREIEANQARKRDTEDVGLDEDYIQDRDGEGNLVTDLVDTLFNPDEANSGNDGQDREYEDNTKST